MNVKVILSLFKCTLLCIFFHYHITLVGSFSIEKGDYQNGLHDMLLKRRNPTGLIPFPRVGKRGFSKWRLTDSGSIKRREGLIPFPRVGKSLDHSKAKINDEDEFWLAWIGPRLDQEYIHKLPPNEKEIRPFSGDRLNPSKSIDEFVLPEELIMNPNNEPLSTNSNKMLEQEPVSNNMASDGWHSLNLEHNKPKQFL